MPRAKNTPLVGVVMGSKSDLPIMQGAIDALKEFKIPHEVKVVSAHRTPEEMLDYGKSANKRGLKAIIAGAGGAAHLPGMLASISEVAVIGVPVAHGPLQGEDALLSIVQMPKGVPVACVGIGQAFNAGLLAVQILATSEPKLSKDILKYKQELRKKVLNDKI